MSSAGIPVGESARAAEPRAEPRAERRAAILAEALHACARATTHVELFAALDAIAEGPLGAVCVEVITTGPAPLRGARSAAGGEPPAAHAPGASVIPQLAAAAVATRAPVTARALETLPGARDDPRLAALIDGGARTLAFVPFGTPRSTPGALMAAYRDARDLDEPELTLLGDVALQAALALERVEWSPAQPQRASDEGERRQRHLALMGELVPALIHDLNNPLTGISAFAELLEFEIVDGDQRESLGYIRREAHQAARLLRDLQALARPATPGTLVELNSLVESALRLRSYLMRGAGTIVRSTLGTGMPPVSVDVQGLLQVMMYVFARAEASVRGAETAHRVLEIVTLWEHDHCLLRVVDSGPGMSPDALRRIFDDTPPVGLSGSTTAPGLGIAKSIVEANGGTLDVSGGPDVPTEVVVRLPVAPLDPRSPASR